MLSCHRQDDESAATTYLKAQSGDEMRWVTVVLPPLQTPPGHHFFFLFIFLVGRSSQINTNWQFGLHGQNVVLAAPENFLLWYFSDWWLFNLSIIHRIIQTLSNKWLLSLFLVAWYRDINGYVKNHSNTDYSKIAYVDAGQDHYSRYYCHTYFFLISLLWRSWIH